MQPAIEIEKVHLHRDGKELLSDINWKVMPGEGWILYGRNGSGKSLLLQITGGYLSASKGSVTRFGLKHGESDLREIRRRIGYLHTYIKNTMHPSENVLEAVVSGLFGSIGIYDQYTAADRKRAQQLLELTGTEKLGEREFGNLSDGEKERVLIARAMMSEPELLLLDEPTSNLDYNGREELLTALQNIRRENKNLGLVMVTHRVDDIIPEFNKMLILKDGKVFRTGTTQELLTGSVLSEALELEVKIFEEYGRFWCAVKA